LATKTFKEDKTQKDTIDMPKIMEIQIPTQDYTKMACVLSSYDGVLFSIKYSIRVKPLKSLLGFLSNSSDELVLMIRTWERRIADDELTVSQLLETVPSFKK